MRKSDVKTWVAALLLAALLPCAAGAAGLGRLTVLSSIGQPLIAEIDLSVTKEELVSLDARLALPDVYRQANLQYNVALTGARITVDKRPNGQAFVRIVSTRPVVEPFIDLLIELRWSSGRLSREYTALLDPPGIPAAPPAPVIAAVPEAARAPAPAPVPAPAPATPAVTEPQPPVAAEPQLPVIAAAPAISTPAPVATPVARAGSKEYGPIERGETLGIIAKSVMPEGVTLEQMLVALYRSNSEAFIRKNLNLVRTGRILRVPDREEVEAIARTDAVQEYRTHVADWNAYRQKLAEAAGTVPAEGRPAASGKITTKVEDKAAADAPKDVVKLSKGEPSGAAGKGKGKPLSPAERVRSLEEDLVARDKALAEANSRIAQLEKTVKDMQKLMELKSPGMAAAQQQAQQAAAKKAEAKPTAPAAPAAPAKPAAKAPEAVAVAKPEPAKPVVAPPADKPAAAPAPEAKPEQAAAAPAPKPQTKPAAKAPPPKPEPSLVDEIIEAATDPLYLAAGGGVIVIGGLAFWMVRRRRSRAEEGDRPPIAPTLSKAAATAAGAAAGTNTDAAATAAAPATDEVDPLAEAEVYIQYGRDGQAEEILKEALAKQPKREDVQLKLLEIYAARKDKTAFGKLAGDFNKLTGGSSDNWIKAAAMGYSLDPANRLYEAGKDAAAATPAGGAGSAAADIDLDLGGGGGTGTSTDITLEAGVAGAAGTDTGILDLGAADAVQPLPSFTLEVPPAGGGDSGLDKPAPAQDAGMIDFQIELPKVSGEPATIAAPPAAAKADAGLDFKLDIPDLEFGDKAAPAAGGEKDGHWYDVQTKFDLAKAYQEMGDKDGAKEILKEVIKDGDAEQKAQAKTLLDSLG